MNVGYTKEWSVSQFVFEFICDVMKKKHGKVILELGSGVTSGKFVERGYDVYSIEQDRDWATTLGQPKVNYIHVPIDPTTGWYDVKKIVGLPRRYDLFLIDGPSGDFDGRSSRLGLLNNLILFDTFVPWVLDDVNDKPIFDMTMDLAKYLCRPPHVYPCGEDRLFAII